MTKRERAQVVELLRCAADFYGLSRSTMWFDTVVFVFGADEQTADIARQACTRVQDEPPFDLERIQATQRGLSVMPNEWGLRVALEAAQRVEDGWTP